MDISSYAMHEPLWIEFLDNLYYKPSEYYLFPKNGNNFENVSKLFPKYFKHKKKIIKKSKIIKKNQKKHKK